MSSSGDVWPGHTTPAWNQTWQLAEGFGWTFHINSSHAFGQIRCESGDCKISVFSTGRGSESVALQARKQINKCPHGERVPSTLAAVRHQLAKADALICAAEGWEKQSKLDARIATLEDSAGTDEWVDYDAFSSLVDEAEAVERELQACLVKLDVPVCDARQATELARSEVSAARATVGDVPPRSRGVEELKGQIQALSARIADLRRRARRA